MLESKRLSNMASFLAALTAERKYMIVGRTITTTRMSLLIGKIMTPSTVSYTENSTKINGLSIKTGRYIYKNEATLFITIKV
jgi:hypothetical protein